MAEEVIIQVTTETDASQLEELDSLIEEIRDNSTIDASVEVEDSSLEEASDKATTLEDELNTIDSTVVTPEVDTSSLDEASGKAEETASSMDNITTAAAGIAATAGIEQMITTADNINTSWNRLELTFANTGVSMDTLKDKSSALSDATGRSGGTIRDYFNQMGIAGVTNTDLLTSSFEALSGKAYQTGNSIESMETKMQMMAMTGNASGRMLRSLGIDTEDLARAMGVTAEEVSEAFKNMTPEQRIEAITKAMGDGKEANEMYKNSYQGLKERADAAMAGLAGAVGQAILPIVIPALETATQFIKMLTDGFKSLPGPVQGAIGAVLGVAAIGTTLIGTLGMVGKVIGGVKTGLETIGMLGKVTSVISSIGGAFSSLWGVLIANPIILVVIAVVALIAALIWAYNNVDWFREMVDNAWQSIQGFAGWISGVFMGAIQGLSDAFNNAGQTLQNAFTGAVQFVQDTLQGLYDYIMTLGGLLPEGVNITGNQIVDSILAVMMFIATLPIQIAMIFMNIIASTLGFGNNFVQTMFNSAMNAVMGFIQWVSQIPSRLGSFLSNAISSAVSFGSNFVSTISNAASNAVSNFVSWISQLPQRLGEELDKMIQQALDFAARLPQIIGEAAANMVGSWVGGSGEESPGFMYDAFIGEIDEMDKVGEDFSKSIPVTMGSAGKNMVDSFNPNLNDTLNGNVVSGSYGNTINLNLEIGSVDSEDRVREIIDVIRRELHWNNKTAGRTV